MKRRAILATTVALALPSIAAAESTEQSEVMTMLIEEVIRDGDMSSLDNIVTEDVTIATLGVTNSEEFEESSRFGYEQRESEFSQLDMTILSMAENGEWVHALVRAEGEKRGGGKSSLTLFYVAQFRSGLISSLYFG